jgi:hypothetical protein
MCPSSDVAASISSLTFRRMGDLKECLLAHRVSGWEMGAFLARRSTRARKPASAEGIVGRATARTLTGDARVHGADDHVDPQAATHFARAAVRCRAALERLAAVGLTRRAGR